MNICMYIYTFSKIQNETAIVTKQFIVSAMNVCASCYSLSVYAIHEIQLILQSPMWKNMYTYDEKWPSKKCCFILFFPLYIYTLLMADVTLIKWKKMKSFLSKPVYTVRCRWAPIKYRYSSNIHTVMCII